MGHQFNGQGAWIMIWGRWLYLAVRYACSIRGRHPMSFPRNR